jgi:two-component system, NarL family, response regulator DevR
VLRPLQIGIAATASSAEAALAQIEQHGPDLFVTEIALENGVDGIECLVRAHHLRAELRSIVLSDAREAVTILRAFRAGASAYVIKDAQPQELASAVRQAFRQSVFFPEPRVLVAEALSAEARKSTALTRRELEILELLAAGSPNAKIASALWVTEQTVKFHLSNIYKKIGVSNRTEAVRWAYRSGVTPMTGASGLPRRPPWRPAVSEPPSAIKRKNEAAG